MKKRLVVPLVGLAISFALPTYAQQKDVADPQTTQKILALCKANEEGHNNHDGAERPKFPQICKTPNSRAICEMPPPGVLFSKMPALANQRLAREGIQTL